MLDQNTDRMWFVIGAVIVGAAIIFIANGTLPTLFASVSDTFEESANKGVEVVQSMRPNTGQNILNGYMIRNHIDGGGFIDVTEYDDNQSVYIESVKGTPLAQYAGLNIQQDELGLEEGSTYELRYEFIKVDGTLHNIGGHLDSMFLNHTWTLDGVDRGRTYHIPNRAITENVYFMEDDSNIHRVVFRFQTPETYNPDADGYDGLIAIQPNRWSTEYVAIQVYNLELVKIG